MADTQYDLVVIGSGPGGYVCAIRAAQLGMKVACVEKMTTLGGTCLNVGCIPSKALLQASEKFEEAQHGLGAFGVKVAGVSLDLPGLMGHKDKVVSANTKGVEFLFKKNKVDRVEGTGRVAGAGTVAVKGKDGKETTLKTKNIVIATGSDSMPLKGVEVDEKKIVSSTGALALDGVPKSMVVIGGGYIGLEMGSVWQRLGTKVTGAKSGAKGVTLTLEAAKGGAAETMDVDVVLLSIGRRAYTDGLGLKEAGVTVDERGRVVTDKHFQSNVPGIYAIGDVIAGPMLAHKAEDEGVAVAEILAGQHGHVNYDAIPGVVYTWPEAATVGKTEEQLKEAGVDYRVGKFPFTANARARAMAATDGFVKVLADRATDRVLGVHIVGPEAGSLIAELVLAMEYGASAEDIARTCHAHPTLNEAVKEAALGVAGRAIHI
jgi:dihydrolipoamide dehydrogenase